MSIFTVEGIIKRSYQLVEILHYPSGRVFNGIEVHNEYKIVTAHMPDKAPLGLFFFYYISDQPADHLYHFVSPAKAVPVIERLKKIDISITYSKYFSPVEPALDLFCN